MICKNCGREVEQGMKFCTYCGDSVMQNNFSDYREFNPSEPLVDDAFGSKMLVAREYSAPPVRSVKKKSGGSTALIVTLSITITLLVITIAAILLVYVGEDNANSNRVSVTLSVNDCPLETEELSYVLSGTASSRGENATLTVNGEQVLTVNKGDGNVSWSKEVWLAKGVNKFTISIKTDSGIEDTEVVEIEYKRKLLYSKGTVLVKSDSAGIYIRYTPAITNESLLYLPYYDYSTRLVCQGEEHVDGEGYIWCKVAIPSGQIGWVRSDIVRKLY